MSALTMTDIAACVLSAKGVESGLVSRVVCLDKIPYQKNDGGGKRFKNEQRDYYRVHIVTNNDVGDDPFRGKINFEAQGENLLAVAREALEKCGLALPLLLQPKTATKK